MRRFIPSPSMAVAVCALIVALGGTATAAALISGSRLTNRSVSGVKVKRNTLTGTEIAESKLNLVGLARRSFSADSVGGLGAARISARQPTGTDDTTILDFGGLQLIGSCSGGNPQLRARSSLNDAELKGTVAGAPVNNTTDPAEINVDNFDTGTTADVLGGKQQGQGTLVYARPDGRVVQATYSFADAPTQGTFNGCVFSGTALAG